MKTTSLVSINNNTPHGVRELSTTVEIYISSQRRKGVLMDGMIYNSRNLYILLEPRKNLSGSSYLQQQKFIYPLRELTTDMFDNPSTTVEIYISSQRDRRASCVARIYNSRNLYILLEQNDDMVCRISTTVEIYISSQSNLAELNDRLIYNSRNLYILLEA